MGPKRRGALFIAGATLLLGLVASACGGSGSTALTPAPNTPSPPRATATPTPSPNPTPPPSPANPDNPEAQIPIFPGAQPASGIEGEPRIGAVDIEPDDYDSIFEAQYLTSEFPDDVVDFYRETMGDSPYSWEQFNVIGAGVLFRVVFTKEDGRYAAWIMAFTTPTGMEPTRILVDVGVKGDSTEVEPTAAP